MRRPGPAPFRTLAAVLLAALPAEAAAQAGADAPLPGSTVSRAVADSLLEAAREAQREFELYRASRIPVKRDDPEGRSCDEQIGRICIWFGGEGEEAFPPEPPETEQARRGLIGVLLETRERVNDAWLTGQLVHYLVEQGDFRYADRIATECGIPETWWCDALRGYWLHVWGEHVHAEAAFQEALGAMPEEERAWWTSPRDILTPDAVEAFDELPSAEAAARWALFWRLSDPLFLVDGNDRLTDHFARLVQVRNFEDAGHPQAMEWDEDLEATLVRYGRIRGWSRTHNPGFSPPGAKMKLVDTRRVVGHHHPNSRGYLFPETFLESPSDIPPESWITAPREARTWYAPPYAPDFRGLETQVGRFRRGDEMFVVGAYRPSRSTSVAGGAPNPFEHVEGPVEAGLFLVPEDGGEAVHARGDEAEGTLTLLAEPGRYVSSIEVLDADRQRAWRARQGVKQEPLVPGLVGLSDLLILKGDAPIPSNLDEAIPWVRPGVRVRGDERFAVVWEVYGLDVREPVRVTVGFTRGRPGFLERVGEFLGVLEPDRPVEVTFTEEGPDRVQSVFRAIRLDLPDVEPGEYTLHVRLDLQGREPVIASRPIVVE